MTSKKPLQIALFISVVYFGIILPYMVIFCGNDTHENVVEKIELPEVNSIDPVPSVDVDEIHCMATNIWHEARGTSYEDRLAVAYVTKNRVKSERFPNNVCSVVFQGKHILNTKTGKMHPIRHKCQFSWYCDGKSDKIRLTDENGTLIRKNYKIWNESWKIAYDVLVGNVKDPTNGATHYLNPVVLKRLPRWTEVYQKVHQTDGHVFYVQTKT